ncbi:MAG: transcription termination/antitermination protein NusG [Lachnospiraceae bacterium]|nr:transcription termination/antitermination protein NusG [Lachnospiraceae bacterium]
MAEANWYVVHTYSGYENKVKANIEKTIENRGLQDQILEVRVPLQDVIEIRNGAKKLVQKKLFPGYVLINMLMNDDTWYVVRNTRGVTGFVGPGSKPVPLSEEEMMAMGVGAENEIMLDFEVGDTVTILSGAWENTQGIVKAINEQKETVTISIDMFGRETPVEIAMTDVKADM